MESIVVYHLAKQARFTVQVAAFNRAGDGLRSDATLAGMSLPVELLLDICKFIISIAQVFFIYNVYDFRFTALGVP